MNACILNSGAGAWAFSGLAARLSAVLSLEVAEEPRSRNYLLFHDKPEELDPQSLFVPLASVNLAGDKRELACVFNQSGVPTPRTVLIEEWPNVERHLADHRSQEWCLKYPTSCGAGGHRLISAEMRLPPQWPRPFVVQEFVRMQRPAVFRIFSAGGEVFGWVERSFSDDVQQSPWVAHARGARYRCEEVPPPEAAEAAKAALKATGLLDSFGCADLLQAKDGRWLVLEVGTDGLMNHVDREFEDKRYSSYLEAKLRDAVHAWLSP